FAAAAIPARYALERGAWADAAALPKRPANTPYTEAITHFARAVGAARSGNPAAATADIEQLAVLRDKLRHAKDAYWTEQVDFEATMKKEPNRFRGLYGGAKAAESAGDRAKARTYYTKLLDVAKEADTERPELHQAKAFLGRR